MTTYSKLNVAGTTRNDFTNGWVKSLTGETNSSSNFSFTFMNYNGEMSNVFTVGEVIEVWIGSTAPAATKIFTGILENKKLGGGQTKNRITITGRDYTARLQDITIQPEVYTNEEVSDIIDDFMTKYAEDVTYNKVVTTTTVPRIVFNHMSIFDALKRLADLSGYYFYVDTDKVLQFAEKGSVSSGVTLDNTNVTKATWDTTRKQISNQVWVYGGEYLSGFAEVFTADGAGSVFTLKHKPHSLNVTVSGIQKIGAVADMISTAPTGVNYLVDFHEKQFIFTSGTDAGYNIPASGLAVSGTYDRSLPVVKVGRNRDSISQYGLKEKVIQDDTIKDPNEAMDLVKSELNENGLPFKSGNLDVTDMNYLVAGQSILVNLPNDEVVNKTYNLLQVQYTLTPEKLLSDQVISVRVNRKITDVTDTIKQLIEDVKAIQGGQIADADIITRLETGIGSIGIKRVWKVSQRNVGSSIVFDSTSKFGWDTSGIGSVYFDALSGINYSDTISGGDY